MIVRRSKQVRRQVPVPYSLEGDGGESWCLGTLSLIDFCSMIKEPLPRVGEAVSLEKISYQTVFQRKGEREKKRIHQPFGLVPEPQAAVQRRVYIKEMPHVPLNI